MVVAPDDVPADYAALFLVGSMVGPCVRRPVGGPAGLGLPMICQVFVPWVSSRGRRRARCRPRATAWSCPRVLNRLRRLVAQRQRHDHRDPIRPLPRREQSKYRQRRGRSNLDLQRRQQPAMDARLNRASRRCSRAPRRTCSRLDPRAERRAPRRLVLRSIASSGERRPGDVLRRDRDGPLSS